MKNEDRLHDAELLAMKMCDNNSCSDCEDGNGCEDFNKRVKTILEKWENG